MAQPVIHWFRGDLRLADNAALSAAAAAGRPLVCVFVLDDETPGPWKLGGARRWWLHHSLASLDAEFRALGGSLALQRGPAIDVIPDLAARLDAETVYFSRRYEPWAVAEETAVADALKARSIAARRFAGALLCEPESMRTKQETPFKVFTPFYRAALAGIETVAPRPAPRRFEWSDFPIESTPLDSLNLLPRTPDWAGGLRATWRPGETAADEALDRFLDAAAETYEADRDKPDRTGTSRLSPYLCFGEISPRQCVARARFRAAEEPALAKGAEAFVRELFWREFCHHLLIHWPEIPERPFRPAYAGFPWRTDADALRDWQRGQTGYPLVDAGMRELWHTGWMHNRVRMVVASFLVKHLLIPWQDGAAWFWDTLVDADLANNAANWQWVAGCGADAAPYFRIFNPVTQGEKFDPGGGYVRLWVPELAGLPDQHIHKPWAAPPEVLAEAGVTLGKTYPAPMVDHAKARQRALAAFESFRKET